MKQLARKGSLVVALFLASVGTVSAECAWVVWQQTIKPVQAWEIFDAHPTFNVCSAWLVEYAMTMKRNGYDVPGLPDGPWRPEFVGREC